jgi:hypothetical protein
MSRKVPSASSQVLESHPRFSPPLAFRAGSAFYAARLIIPSSSILAVKVVGRMHIIIIGDGVLD